MDTDHAPTLSAAELRDRLTRAYLAGDGGAVVTIMTQLAEAEQREATPPSPHRAAA